MSQNHEQNAYEAKTFETVPLDKIQEQGVPIDEAYHLNKISMEKKIEINAKLALIAGKKQIENTFPYNYMKPQNYELPSLSNNLNENVPFVALTQNSLRDYELEFIKQHSLVKIPVGNSRNNCLYMIRYLN